MPSRREIVSGLLVTSPMLAGCLGESEDPGEEQMELQEERIDELEAELDDGDSTSSSPDTVSSTDSQEPENLELRENIVATYNDGVQQQNRGVRTQERGTAAYNNDDYSEAERLYLEAKSDYEAAETTFSDAIDLTYELGDRSAREICETASESATIHRQAVDQAIRSAQAAGQGDFDRAGDRSSQANQLLREAQRLDVRNPEVLQSTLGLD